MPILQTLMDDAYRFDALSRITKADVESIHVWSSRDTLKCADCRKHKRPAPHVDQGSSGRLAAINAAFERVST
jgi:hypothetical protein